MSLLSMIGLLGAGAISSATQVATNKRNIENQLKNNAWSQELSDSAHQREVLDLYKAGLNPILSASGSGASVPSLGTGVEANPGQGLSDGISSASNLFSSQYRAQVDQIKASTHNTNADTSAKKVQQDLVGRQIENEEIRNDILAQERAKGQMDSFNRKLQDSAIAEAITGKRSEGLEHLIDWDDKKAVETYHNLVDKYRNQIELDRYLNSVERQMVIDAGNSAKSVIDMRKDFSGAKSTINHIHSRRK